MFLTRLLAIVICVPLTLCCGCSKKQSAPGAKLAGRAADCNVLLITLDTTRADYLGCYGHPGNITPVLDNLARTGVRFDNAFTDAPITLPAHTSLMTGTLPPEHGVRDNGRFALGSELPTLAEAYRQHGYRTAAFIASPVLQSHYGLNRGFDTYSEDPPPPNQPQSSCSADVVCDRALAALASLRDQRFFCWVHLYDPHAPYTPPQQYLSQAGGDSYGGEVAFMDANIGRLIRWLEDNRLRERTLVVAIADHGEGLNNHGYIWHSLLMYGEIMRIPLIMSLPGRLPQNVVRNDLVAISDVAPTLLELAGWPVPQTVSGASLLPALAGAAMPVRAIYGETEFPYYSFGWSPLYSLTTPDCAYIRGPRPELYDRKTDPGQLNDLAAARPDVLAQLESQLQALEAGMNRHGGAAVKNDLAQQRALRSLGYAGDTPTPTSRGAGLKNPRDMIKVEYDYRVAQSLAQHAPDDAIKLLEPAVQQSPESYAILYLLGNCYGLARRLDESQLLLTKALELYPESAGAALDLVVTLRDRGRFAHAIELCQQVLQREPDHPRAGQMLPTLLDGLRKQQTAIAQEQLAFAADEANTDPEIVRNLADLLAVGGRESEALDVLQKAHDAARDNPQFCAALAWYRATAGDQKLRDGQQALELAEQAVRTGKPDPRSAAALAAAYAEVGRFEDAARTARQIRADLGTDERIPYNLDYQIKQYEAGRPYHELP
jgi:arylsulfatase A-like enzyme/Flp pilus assembly protein TadD